MKKCDFVKINDKGIYGIKSPNLNICLSSTKKDTEYIVIIDGKTLKLEQVKKSDNKVVITGPISPKCKTIEIVAKYKNKKYLVCTMKNTFIYRIIIRIKGIVLGIVRKINSSIRVLTRAIRFLWREHHFIVPPALWVKYFKLLIKKLKSGGDVSLYNPDIKYEYQKWLQETEDTYEAETQQQFKYQPLISIIIPVYNVSKKLLSECLDSVLNQSYENFEVCIADDCSTNQETLNTLKEYSKKDKRIKVLYRKQNGHISEASNSALEIAKGEFIALMDNDDIIEPNALYEMVKMLNENKKIDMIYTDEDKIDLDGKRCEPNFKTDFAPDTLLSVNYICHFTLLRKKIVDELGGWRKGYEGAQDYDLFLRFTEKTNKICHIPKILYHWRKTAGSTSMKTDNKNYAIINGKKAIEDALKRRKIKAVVNVHDRAPYFNVSYKYDKEPMVSILVPTKDYAETLEVCLKSVYEKTEYSNYEVIVINNNSEKEETFELFEKYKKEYSNFKVVDAIMEFNYSKINNLAAEQAKGDYIVLLNNDTEVISENWLKEMVGYAMQKHIGTVGVKLLYPDDTVQHAGVVMGIGGVAGHVFINCEDDANGYCCRLIAPYNYSVNTAACLMVSKKKFFEVGGLEEELKVAYNDVDFSLKLLEKGYYNVCIPQVKLHHYESKSRGLDNTTEKYKRFIQESNYLTAKWESVIKNDRFYNPNLSRISGFMLDRKQNNK